MFIFVDLALILKRENIEKKKKKTFFKAIGQAKFIDFLIQ